MRGRGLKLGLEGHFFGAYVALHAGAWIETLRCSTAECQSQSPLMRGRGLKQALKNT